MFEAKLNDLTAQNDQSRQRIEQQEREKELLERTHQSRLDELTQNLQQEKGQHQEYRTKYFSEKDKAENLQRQVINHFDAFLLPLNCVFSSMKSKRKSLRLAHRRLVEGSMNECFGLIFS